MRFQQEVGAEELASAPIPDKVIRGATDHPSQVRHTTQGRDSLPPLATDMNRDYIDWLTSLPCNRGIRDRQVNVWMAGYASLSTEIDLPRYEEWQQELIQRDALDGVMPRLWHWVRR